MNEKTLFVFKKLMISGYIDREIDETAFGYFNEDEIAEELEIMQRELDFKLLRTGGRVYLIPNNTNELFSQDNSDFKKSIGSDAKLDDIYLLDYIGIYLLYIFYHGSGSSPLSRDFILVSDFINEFTRHCEQVKSDCEALEAASKNYSIDFVRIAENWLAKTGEISNGFDSKYGCCKKVIRKFLIEELFTCEDDKLRPTRKLNDLMPFFLSQQRISDINDIIAGGNENAVNQ